MSIAAFDKSFYIISPSDTFYLEVQLTGYETIPFVFIFSLARRRVILPTTLVHLVSCLTVRSRLLLQVRNSGSKLNIFFGVRCSFKVFGCCHPGTGKAESSQGKPGHLFLT